MDTETVLAVGGDADPDQAPPDGSALADQLRAAEASNDSLRQRLAETQARLEESMDEVDGLQRQLAEAVHAATAGVHDRESHRGDLFEAQTEALARSQAQVADLRQSLTERHVESVAVEHALAAAVCVRGVDGVGTVENNSGGSVL